ncbi:MAG: hypothetical protein Q9173_002922 [Seirophora scorigena]
MLRPRLLHLNAMFSSKDAGPKVAQVSQDIVNYLSQRTLNPGGGPVDYVVASTNLDPKPLEIRQNEGTDPAAIAFDEYDMDVEGLIAEHPNNNTRYLQSAVAVIGDSEATA